MDEKERRAIITEQNDRIAAFLIDLAELSKAHGVAITGCLYCDSVFTAVDAGRSTGEYKSVVDYSDDIALPHGFYLV